LIPLTNLAFDMRAPSFGAPIADLYAAALDMCAYADEIGFQAIGLMEHHGSDDNYLPAPFVLGGGVAARTDRATIRLGAVLLPLHDPVKVAEQIAVLDIMSGGRLEVVLGAGYVPSEFAMFGASLRDRGKALDKGIDIILRALRGESFTVDDRPIRVTPLPMQKPEDILYAGGGVAASARRAARFGIGFAPMGPGLLELYDAECAKLGRAPGKKRTAGLPLSIHVSDDPARDWPKMVPHALHVCQSYSAWSKASGDGVSPFDKLDSLEALQASGMFVVWSPEETIEKGRAMMAEGRPLSFMPLLGGMAPAMGWRSMRLVGDKVLPHLR